MPPDAVATGFRMLTADLGGRQYATLWQNLWNDEYVDGYQAMAQWAGDHVPFPGGVMRQVVEQLVRGQRARQRFAAGSAGSDCRSRDAINGARC